MVDSHGDDDRRRCGDDSGRGVTTTAAVVPGMKRMPSPVVCSVVLPLKSDDSFRGNWAFLGILGPVGIEFAI